MTNNLFPKKKKKRRSQSKVKSFLILFFLFAALIFLAVHFYGSTEKAYPRHDFYLVNYYCSEYGVEPNLVYAIMKQESAFNAGAVSAKGAKGLMQIMPATAEWASEKLGLDYDEEKLFQSSYNLKIGIWYLSYLMTEFEGDLIVTIAAYNAGEGNVKEWLKGGTWDGTLANSDNIPFPETKQYLEKVCYNLEKYQKIYGFS